eukprot:362824-Chlamydomonas_euryale.AAC.14
MCPIKSKHVLDALVTHSDAAGGKLLDAEWLRCGGMLGACGGGLRGAPSGFLDAEEMCAAHAVLAHCSGSMDSPHHGGGSGGSGCGDVWVDAAAASGSPSSGSAGSPLPSPHAMQFLLLDDDDSAAAATALPRVSRAAAPAALAVHTAGPGGCGGDVYCLAVVDEATGLPLRPATPEETWEDVDRTFVLHKIDALPQTAPPTQKAANMVVPAAVDAVELHAPQPNRVPVGVPTMPAAQTRPMASPHVGLAQQPEAAPAATELPPPPLAPRRPEPRRCGPCDNCCATESPQWRQGPPAKPLLCNACGMRFRRTSQLTLPSDGAPSAGSARGGAAAAAAAAARGRKRGALAPASA